MYEAKIDLRLKNILQIMFNHSDYITVTMIAKSLDVSSRTILRELPAVEKWIEKRGCKLDKKAGVGIRLNGSCEDRERILRLLVEEKEEKIYTPKERQIIIASELLQGQDPVKVYSLTRTLNVAEGTIGNDLDKIEALFKKYDLALIRKQGVGVYIEGEEDNIRKCMINLIYENINESYLLSLIQNGISIDSGTVSNTELIARSRLLNLVNYNTIHQLESLVHRAEEHIGHKLADTAYVGLIVHLAIAVQRIRKNEDIVMDRRFMDELKSSREYSVAQSLALEIEKIFEIKIPEDEIGYISMHIKGSKNINNREEDGQSIIDNFELVKLAKEIIRIAENETGKFISQNEKLLIDMVNHLAPAMCRLKMNLEIRNPLLKEIQTHYPDLMKVARKCAEAAEEYFQMKIPEPEIAYIAMHLGAAIEKSQTAQKYVYRAAIACATGIGTSKLLATRIEKEYGNIHIEELVSALRIDKDWLKEKGIDFIISTVGMEECSVPVVIVNPLLFEEDKTKISKFISQLKIVSHFQPSNKRKTLKLKEIIQALNHYGEAITEILNNFFLFENCEAEEINYLIDEVCREIAPDKINGKMLEDALKAREAKGGTFITGYGILLLHCRTQAVDQIYFGAVKVKKDIYCMNSSGEKERVEFGVVILAPEECSKYFLETLSHVNGMLIENPGFNWLLKNGTRHEAFNELSRILEDFYKLKSEKYLLD